MCMNQLCKFKMQVMANYAKQTVSIILGGGAGSRLSPLTARRSKPAVPIAGKYRLVDIPISNCINSKTTTKSNQKKKHHNHRQTKIKNIEDLEIEANSEEEFKRMVVELLNESYNLNVWGYHHNPDTDVKIEIDTYN